MGLLNGGHPSRARQTLDLGLALKYRKRVRPVARRIPVDVIPVRPDPEPGTFLAAVEHGEGNRGQS